ncbi:MAG: membrane protein insertase YidC [Chitinophagales bacterium]
MDKNTITGIVIIALLFLVMSVYNNKQQEKLEEAQATEQKAENKASEKALKDSIQPVAVDKTKDSVSNAQALGTFASFANGTAEEIQVENEDCIYTFSTKGGYLKSVELKAYKTYYQKPLILFEQSPSDFNISFVSNNGQKTIETANLYFTPNGGNQKVSGDNQYNLTFSIQLEDGSAYQHEYIIHGKSYMVDFNIHATNFEKVIPSTAAYFTFNWRQVLYSQERSVQDERTLSTIHYCDNEERVDDISPRKDVEKTIETPLKWLSFSQKFFNTTIITKDKPFPKNAKVTTTVPTDDSSLVVKTMTAQIKIPFNQSSKFDFNTSIYTGPSKYKSLKKLGNNMQKIVSIGGSILGLVNKWIVIPLFDFLHKFIKNYGIIILILALFIKIITLPFTYKSNLSMIKMRVLKPELDELKEKYKNDKSTFSAKQMELYQQTGVSPLGGCLPMLMQWPFLIAMYRFFPSAIELRQEKFLWASDLSTYDAPIHLPFNIPLIGDHLSLFALLGVATSFGYTLIMMKLQPQQPTSSSGDGEDFAEAMQKQMRVMQYFFPIMILFFFNKSSAALSYYFFLYNAFSLLQQWIMTKFFIDEKAIRAQIEHNKKNPKKKSAFQQRMEEMMKQQQEIKNQQKKK